MSFLPAKFHLFAMNLPLKYKLILILYNLKKLLNAIIFNNQFNNNSQLFNAPVIRIPLNLNTNVNTASFSKNNNLDIIIELDPTILQTNSLGETIGPINSEKINYYLTFAFKYKTIGEIDYNRNFRIKQTNV